MLPGKLFWPLFLAMLPALATAAERIPPEPPRYFNQYANIVSPETAARLERTLEDFEKKTSSQILVVVYPTLPPGAVLEDYTIRAASAWKAGQRAKDNGAILFVFTEDRRMRIEVGYGLEGALPDALAKRIIDEEIRPHFQRGNYDAGLVAGVTAIVRAAQGEYTGTGRTVGARRGVRTGGSLVPLIILVLFLLVFFSAFRRRGTVFHRRRRTFWDGWGGWSAGQHRGGWSGSGGGFSGGGFSGGGGRFGGGGASGSW